MARCFRLQGGDSLPSTVGGHPRCDAVGDARLWRDSIADVIVKIVT